MLRSSPFWFISFSESLAHFISEKDKKAYRHRKEQDQVGYGQVRIVKFIKSSLSVNDNIR
ncbi:hypothetical protein C7R93_17870 [Brevibacillus fortis]|uniref:Uncharacterized protein n=1 Tax=Brevibacillus fortis TaxID=2126352 RepID=A0A2P7V2H1_9BACL|nr:hypothetical protein C7R93_17870 [Brevibacillus fortis]